MSEAEAEVLDVAAVDIEARHIAGLESLTEDQKVTLARELLALKVAEAAARKGVVVTRRETLDTIFAAEAGAVSQGFQPQVDFFLPLDNELPLRTS